MSKTEKQSKALALYEHDQVKLAGDQLSSLERAAIHQIGYVRREEKENSVRVILCGLALRRIKASLNHGEWLPWQNLHLVPICGESATRTVRNYMKLADCFVESARLSLPDFLALPGDQAELALSAESDDTARQLMQRLGKFVGDVGPTELMYKYGVRQDSRVEKTRRLAGGSDEAAPMTDAEKEMTVQERFNEIEATLKRAVSGATDKAFWLAATRQQHDDLRAMFLAATAQVSEAHTKTHGRKN